jgi:ubiquinone/menaquinone biosynthesis C-methylase UbiE
VVATEYTAPPFLGPSILRLGGVNLNAPLPFKDATFDGVNLVEVIEHVEHQPQLIREIGRVLKPSGVVVISTPNVLNMFSRLRFLFTGFLRGRVRPLHYQHKPGIAHNIYLIHFYELYYLLFHYGFEIAELRKTRIKFVSPFFAVWLYPFMWVFSIFSVIRPENDSLQRQINWQIVRAFLKPPLLFSDNIVVKARKRRMESKISRALSTSNPGERRKAYARVYDGLPEHRRDLPPSQRRRQRIRTYCQAIGTGKQAVLEVGCGVGDLTYALRNVAQTVIGSDVSSTALSYAKARASLWTTARSNHSRVCFAQMNATDIAFPDATFDAVLSTSMIEHLHPDDVAPHLREVWRVLKPEAEYLVWCPNGLGHHNDRDFHLAMFSYRELIMKMREAGFDEFRSFMFNKFPFRVDAEWKVFLEEFLTKWKIDVLWSHLGVRNILLVGKKQVESQSVGSRERRDC